MSDNTALLPEGFCDLIGYEAELNYKISNDIIGNFISHNFTLVKTPLVEYEKTISNYQKLNDRSLHVADIVTGKNLVFRNDITVQISRLVNTRLKDTTRPLRLCYVGDVLKINNKDLHANKQNTQAGIELIGDDGKEAIKEVINITLDSNKKLNVSDLTIEFCLPKFLDLLLDEINVEDRVQLRRSIIHKNISKISEFGGDDADILISLVLDIDNPEKIKDNLSQLNISDSLKGKINNFFIVVDDVIKNYKNVNVLISIFSDKEFIYHQEVGFTVFAKNSFYPIARGGKYEINKNTPAVGSTIYVDNIREMCAR